MRILLDTHVLIWLLADNPKLPEAERARLALPGVEIFFSSVSILEIAIKHSLKPEMMSCAPEEVRTAAMESGFSEIPFTSQHAEAVGNLPWLHRDPFDRMLVAQARIEGLRLLTHDDSVKEYGVEVLGF